MSTCVTQKLTPAAINVIVVHDFSTMIWLSTTTSLLFQMVSVQHFHVSSHVLYFQFWYHYQNSLFNRLITCNMLSCTLTMSLNKQT